jgi:hypothetical protein
MKSTKKLPPANGPRGEIDDGGHPGASPSLRGHLDCINNTAADHFPQVIAAIETERSIPQKERDWIAEQLIGAAGIYELRVKVEANTLPPAEQRRRFEKIAGTSVLLLRHLGFADPARLAFGCPSDGLPWPLGHLLPTLQAVAVERRGKSVTWDAQTRIRTLPLLISDLAQAAKQAAGPANPLRGRGGRRRDGPEALGELVNAVFEVYAAIRKRCPASGPKPAYSPNGPLVRFVLACMKVIDPDLQVRGPSIRGYYDRWRPRSRSRPVHISN